MRRRWTMVLTLALPLAAYSASSVGAAFAQTAAKPKTTKAAKPGASASASAAASSSAAPPDSAASAAASAPPPPPAVSVDMTTQRPPDTAMNGATYAVRLRDLEQRVDELKDQIRRSHTRLALLSDTIVGGGTAGSRSEITFDNEMSSAFKLTKAV